MHILQIGGLQSVSLALAKYQVAAGCDVEIMHDETCADQHLGFLFPSIQHSPSLRAIETSRFDVIQIHGNSGLRLLAGLSGGVKNLNQTLNSISQSGTLLFFYAYGEALSADLWAQTLNGSFFSHVFISGPEHALSVDRHLSWTLLPLPIDLEQVTKPAARVPRAHEIRLIYLNGSQNASPSEFIGHVEQQLIDQGLKFEINQISFEQIPELNTFRRILRKHHILIDTAEDQRMELATIEALAQGVCVVSTRAGPALDQWPTISMSPILRCQESQLQDKLSAIIREPRCLKDLASRSRLYIERNHSAQLQAQRMLEVYLKALKLNLSKQVSPHTLLGM